MVLTANSDPPILMLQMDTSVVPSGYLGYFDFLLPSYQLEAALTSDINKACSP